MSELGDQVNQFLGAVGRFEGFDQLGFTVGDLRADSKWPWGHGYGVYCFVVDDVVVYVGRALGCTLGERLWDQLRSTSGPEWTEVVTRDVNRIELFSVPKEQAFMGAALEAYLIGHLRPRFNKRVS